MPEEKVTRRAFIQCLAGTVTASLLPKALLANPPSEAVSCNHDAGASDFVIINGWVLLKSDLEHEQG